MQFQPSSRRNKIPDENIPESSRSETLRKFFANNLILSNADDNISGSLYRGGIGDVFCWEHY